MGRTVVGYRGARRSREFEVRDRDPAHIPSTGSPGERLGHRFQATPSVCYASLALDSLITANGKVMISRMPSASATAK